MSRIIPSNVIEKMRDSFNVDIFGLKKNFIGEYTVNRVLATKTRAAREENEDNNNFNVEVSGNNGRSTLSGFQLVNAYLLSKDIPADAKKVNDIEGVYFADDIEDALSTRVLFNTKFEEDADFEFPEKVEIVGAIVYKGEDEKPRIPLRLYKHYTKVLKHHQKEIGEEKAFMTREEFESYLKRTDETRPTGIPADAKSLQLSGTLKADDVANWSFRLLLKDIA